jgi:hypothetical protein
MLGSSKKTLHLMRGRSIFDCEGSQAVLAHPSGSVFENYVLTSKKTQHFHYKDQLFDAVYGENHTKPVSIKCSIINC